MKFGGTSVANLDKISNVADIVEREQEKHKIIVVLSAMAGTTNHLQAYLDKIKSSPSPENDLVLTSGEQITVGLLSSILNQRKIKSMPILGWQIPIITDEYHEKAKILNINKEKILSHLKKFDVLVLAGFQGVSPRTKDVTTLGRGGSDLTAVALAAQFQAKRCEIFTDVAGVFTAHPRFVPTARLIPKMSWGSLVRLAGSGVGVVHARAARVAYRYNIPLWVREAHPTMEDKVTVVEGSTLEQSVVEGIACVERATFLKGQLNQGEIKLLQELDGEILFSVYQGGESSVCLLGEVSDTLLGLLKERGSQNIQVQHQVACLTIIGNGLLDIEGLMQKALHQEALHIDLSDTQLRLVVVKERFESSLESIHSFLEETATRCHPDSELVKYQVNTTFLQNGHFLVCTKSRPSPSAGIST